jgi:hypothetical protein
MESDRVSVSQLCADFSGDEQDVRGRQPCIIFQIGNSRFQIGSLTVRDTCPLTIRMHVELTMDGIFKLLSAGRLLDQHGVILMSVQIGCSIIWLQG